MGLRVTSTGVVVSTPGVDEITQDICCRGEEPRATEGTWGALCQEQVRNELTKYGSGGGGGGGVGETQEIGFLLRPSSEPKAQSKGEAWSWAWAHEAREPKEPSGARALATE